MSELGCCVDCGKLILKTENRCFRCRKKAFLTILKKHTHYLILILIACYGWFSRERFLTFIYCCMLIWLYYDGRKKRINVFKDKLKTVTHNISNGDKNGFYEMAVLLQNGFYPKNETYFGSSFNQSVVSNDYVDLIEAVKYYKLSAENGVVDSLCELENFYYNGVGVPKDKRKAFLYFLQIKRLSFSLSSFDNIQHFIELEEAKLLLQWYSETNKDDDYYKSEQGLLDFCIYAADNDFMPAQHYLFRYYLRRNIDEAIKYAILTSDNYPDASLVLAEYYLKGINIEKDNEKSQKLQNKAFRVYLCQANNGEEDSMYMVAYCYYFGLGVKTSEKHALKWLKLSAYDGYDKAIERLNCYNEYRHLSLSPDIALDDRWYPICVSKENLITMERLYLHSISLK